MSDFSKMTLDALLKAHRSNREAIAKLQEQQRKIEEYMQPLQLRQSALRKVKRAGLSEDELKALK